MKAKQPLYQKRGEVNIVATPLFSISFHRGVGSFSTHRRYEKNFLPVTNVALKVGYSTVGHFSYQFKKQYVASPKNFNTKP